MNITEVLTKEWRQLCEDPDRLVVAQAFALLAQMLGLIDDDEYETWLCRFRHCPSAYKDSDAYSCPHHRRIESSMDY